MGRWRRILRVALVSLLMGVGTTYGVAWALANVGRRWDPGGGENILSSDDDGWSSHVEVRFGETSCRSLIIESNGHRAWVSWPDGQVGGYPAWSVVEGTTPSELVGANST